MGKLKETLKEYWENLKYFFTKKNVPHEKECDWPKPRNYGDIQLGKDFSFGLLIRGSFTNQEHRVYFDIDGDSMQTLSINGKEVKCNSKMFFEMEQEAASGVTPIAKLEVIMKKPSLGKHTIRIHTTNRFHNHVKYIATFNVKENVTEEFANSDVKDIRDIVVKVDVEKS